jgi:signal transduction histidine kinase
MVENRSNQTRRLLAQQVHWLVRLRWVAGLVVILGSAVDGLWLKYHEMAPWITLIGAVILAYNGVLLWRLRCRSRGLEPQAPMVWLHVLPDLACLAVLTVWTGGVESPLLGFFVFHMVFTSLLFRPLHAYGVVLAAGIMFAGSLWLSDEWPKQTVPRLMLMGWAITLLVTIFLTNHITSALRRNRAQLMAKNKHVRGLVRRLKQQQQAMIQHEKMVGLGQMAAGVAHEVANPLASMDSVLQLMQRNDKHISPENVDALRQQVQRIKQTVHQLTDFAHPTEYKWETIPINDAVEAALQMVRFDRRQRKVTIDKQLSHCNERVEVQPHALQQVLTNLLFNALDALDDLEVSDPRLQVGTACNGEVCRIWVSDNGPGINPDHMERLFEPFFTTKPVGKGTGLGLAISYSLVRNQGGHIEFDNQPGEGVTATIHLPMHRGG